MRCQREGCGDDALYAVQLMSTRGYRVGLCRACAVDELAGIGIESSLDLLGSEYSYIITDADWWKPHFHYNRIDADTLDRLQREAVAKLVPLIGLVKANKILKEMQEWKKDGD